MNKAAKKAKIAKVMKEFKAGTLNSGSSRGPVVKGTAVSAANPTYQFSILSGWLIKALYFLAAFSSTTL